MTAFQLSWYMVLGLFFGVLAALEIGRRLGRRRVERGDSIESNAGTGAIDGSVFGLLGLIIAFTFYGAASRFDTRRELIVQEVNAVGTAYLRIDLLPEADQAPVRDLFRRYVDLRLRTYEYASDFAAAKAVHAQALELQGQIWKRSIEALADPRAGTTPLVVGSLNEMFDIASERAAAIKSHPPLVIFVVLAVLAVVCGLLAGQAIGRAKRRDILHMLAFAGVMALTVFLIVDLEYPRLGFITVNDYDELFVELRRAMG